MSFTDFTQYTLQTNRRFDVSSDDGENLVNEDLELKICKN